MTTITMPLSEYERLKRIEEWNEKRASLCSNGSAVIAAEFIARAVHVGQKDKSGADYIDHPRRVSEAVASLGEKYAVVGWLHDTVEDTPLTLEVIQLIFGEEVSEAVKSVTRHYGIGRNFYDWVKEPYADTIKRAKSNPIGRLVKMADLNDNLDPKRLALIGKQGERLELRYRKALSILEAD